MLLDPLTLTYGYTPGASTGGQGVNFRRTDKGRFSAIDGPFSADQMARMIINSNTNKLGMITSRVGFEMDKNVAMINGIAQRDDVLKFSMQLTHMPRSFSETECRHAINFASSIFSSFVGRINAGES